MVKPTSNIFIKWKKVYKVSISGKIYKLVKTLEQRPCSVFMVPFRSLCTSGISAYLILLKAHWHTVGCVQNLNPFIILCYACLGLAE